MLKTTQKLSSPRLLFLIFLCYNGFQTALAGKNTKKNATIGQRIKSNPRERKVTDRYNPNSRLLSNQEKFYNQIIAAGVKERNNRKTPERFNPMTQEEVNKKRAKRLTLRNKYLNKKK